MKKNVFLLLLGIAIVPAGCTMAPKYNRPKAPVPAECRTAPPMQEFGGDPAARTPAVSQLRWQEFFSDEKLQQIIGMALTNNRDCGLRLSMWNSPRPCTAFNELNCCPRSMPTAARPNNGFPPMSRASRTDDNRKLRGQSCVASWEIDFFGVFAASRMRPSRNIWHRTGPPQCANTSDILGGRRVSDPGRGSGEFQAAETTLEAQRAL